MNNTTWFYDDETGRYIVRNARILWPNFQGAEQDYNQAGKRNFKLRMPESLAKEMQDRGINVRELEPRNEDDEISWTMKIGVYRDADIRFLSGKAMQKMKIDNEDPDEDCGEMIDDEFRKGHVRNGEVALEFHVSRNTKVPSGGTYVRLDTMVIPIRKSRLLEDYDEEDTPM